MTMLARTTEGMHNLFRHGLPRLARRADGQGPAHGPRAARPPTATASSPPPAAPPARCRRASAWASTTRPAAPPGSSRTSSARRTTTSSSCSTGSTSSRRVIPDLLRLSKDIGAPLLATNDSHYVKAEDHAHPRRAAVHQLRLGARRPQPVQVHRRHLLRALRRGDARGVARPPRRVRQHPPRGRAVRRRSSAPRRTARTTCRSSRSRRGRTSTPGSSRRSSGACTTGSRTASRTTCASRPSTRSAIITQMGFPGYFLVVADYIKWAKDQGIRVGPGRGSGAGSMVAYAHAHHRPQPARATG